MIVLAIIIGLPVLLFGVLVVALLADINKKLEKLVEK